VINIVSYTRTNALLYTIKY